MIQILFAVLCLIAILALGIPSMLVIQSLLRDRQEMLNRIMARNYQEYGYFKHHEKALEYGDGRDKPIIQTQDDDELGDILPVT